MKKRGERDQLGVLSFLVLGIKSTVWSRLDRQPSTEALLRTRGHSRGATGDCGLIASQSGRLSSFSAISGISFMAPAPLYIIPVYPQPLQEGSPLVQAQ